VGCDTVTYQPVRRQNRVAGVRSLTGTKFWFLVIAC
jgi:hypothetical protein